MVGCSFKFRPQPADHTYTLSLAISGDQGCVQWLFSPSLGEQKVSGPFGQGHSESWVPGTEAGMTHRLQGGTFLASLPEEVHGREPGG